MLGLHPALQFTEIFEQSAMRMASVIGQFEHTPVEYVRCCVDFVCAVTMMCKLAFAVRSTAMFLTWPVQIASWLSIMRCVPLGCPVVLFHTVP